MHGLPACYWINWLIDKIQKHIQPYNGDMRTRLASAAGAGCGRFVIAVDGWCMPQFTIHKKTILVRHQFTIMLNMASPLRYSAYVYASQIYCDHTRPQHTGGSNVLRSTENWRLRDGVKVSTWTRHCSSTVDHPTSKLPSTCCSTHNVNTVSITEPLDWPSDEKCDLYSTIYNTVQTTDRVCMNHWRFKWTPAVPA